MVKIYYLLFKGNRGHAYILEVRAPHPFRQNYSLNYLIPSIVFAANTCRFPSEYRWKQFELAYQDVPPLQKWTNQRSSTEQLCDSTIRPHPWKSADGIPSTNLERNSRITYFPCNYVRTQAVSLWNISTCISLFGSLALIIILGKHVRSPA